MLAISPNQVSPYSTSSALILLLILQTCQNIARMIEISSISLVHRMHGWAYRMVHQIWSDKNN